LPPKKKGSNRNQQLAVHVFLYYRLDLFN